MNDVYISPAFELYHFGIKGMKWGLRRYQNEDGSLTAEGRRHYGYGDGGQKYFNKDGSLSERGRQRYESRETKKNRKKYGDHSVLTKTSAEYDTKIAKQKGGKMLSILSPSAAKTYRMARALGESKGKATLRAVFDLNAGTIAGAASGHLAAAVVSKLANQRLSLPAFITASYAGKQLVDAAIARSDRTISVQQQALRAKSYYMKSLEQRARYQKKR